MADHLGVACRLPCCCFIHSTQRHDVVHGQTGYGKRAMTRRPKQNRRRMVHSNMFTGARGMRQTQTDPTRHDPTRPDLTRPDPTKINHKQDNACTRLGRTLLRDDCACVAPGKRAIQATPYVVGLKANNTNGCMFFVSPPWCGFHAVDEGCW